MDRGRSPIRPVPGAPTSPGDAADPVEAAHEIDVETSSLAAQELALLLAQEEDEDFSLTTVRLDASELDLLLAQSRPVQVPAVPPSRPLLVTQPYDAVTAYVLLDKDTQPSDPQLVAVDLDAPDELEALDEEAELDEKAPEVVAAPEPIAPAATAPPLVENAIAAIVAAPEPPAPASSRPVAPPPPPSSSPASAPPPIVLPPAPTRASLPSAGLEWPGAQDRRRRAITILTILGALAAITILYSSFAEPEPTVAPAVPTAEPVPPAPSPPAARVQSPAEIDARAALGRLREGIGDCVRHAIGTLPGSSPAVPSGLKLAGGAGYTAPPADWKTAVWSCAKFHHDTPMQFQLQWQSVKPGVEALGIAWIDDDGDGDADRALGFRATMKGARDVDLGEVAPLEMRPVLPVR